MDAAAVAPAGTAGFDPPTAPAPGTEALDRIEQELGAVDAAMARLDDATYGTCIRCASPLDDGALQADPTSSSCPEHR